MSRSGVIYAVIHEELNKNYTENKNIMESEGIDKSLF
jgi:hypothetical protein